MTEEKQQETKVSIPFFLVSGAVFLAAWYIIQKRLDIKFFIPYLIGFGLSVGGILYISSKILIAKKPFTDCKKMTPSDLSTMTIFLTIISFTIAFRTPTSSERILLVQYVILLMNILMTAHVIQAMVVKKKTRESVILLVLLVSYFWTGFYVYSVKLLPPVISAFLNSLAVIAIGLGIYILSQQKDEKELFYEQIEKLQKTRETAKELQSKLSESGFVKTLSHLSNVPLSETPPPKIAWDVDYEIRRTKENSTIAKQLKEQLTYLEQLKHQEPSVNEHKLLLSLIDQAKKHIENLKQQISQLEKPKLTTQRITSTSNYYHVAESIRQLQQNTPIIIDKINAAFTQMQTILQQQKEKMHTQQQQHIEQALNKLKSEVDRLGGITDK